MASKRNQRRKSCIGKVKYTSEDDALKSVYHLKRLNAKNAIVSRISPYKCHFCGSWHVGHLNNNAKRCIAIRRGE
jgi:predicted Zn-ribbon and HTH transcriptional regulator